MRLRLLVRRLTVSAPRMAVRSALPWPLRWMVLAIAFGFCAAIALWAFEFGRDIAGLDHNTRAELQDVKAQLLAQQQELTQLREARDKAESVANTADTLLTAEKVSLERVTTLNKQLEAANRSLRNDLGFFEKLIPAVGGAGLSIRALQAEALSERELKWQVLVIQSSKNPPEFSGQLVLSFVGTLHGKPWSGGPTSGGQAIRLTQYGRIEGVFEVPEQVVVKGVTAKVMDGPTVKAVQSIKL